MGKEILEQGDLYTVCEFINADNDGKINRYEGKGYELNENKEYIREFDWKILSFETHYILWCKD